MGNSTVCPNRLLKVRKDSPRPRLIQHLLTIFTLLFALTLVTYVVAIEGGWFPVAKVKVSHQESCPIWGMPGSSKGLYTCTTVPPNTILTVTSEDPWPLGWTLWVENPNLDQATCATGFVHKSAVTKFYWPSVPLRRSLFLGFITTCLAVFWLLERKRAQPLVGQTASENKSELSDT